MGSFDRCSSMVCPVMVREAGGTPLGARNARVPVTLVARCRTMVLESGKGLRSQASWPRVFKRISESERSPGRAYARNGGKFGAVGMPKGVVVWSLFRPELRSNRGRGVAVWSLALFGKRDAISGRISTVSAKPLMC